jgi:hypothetical protein
MTIDPELASILEKSDKLDVALAVEIASYVREEMHKIDEGMTDKMKRIEERISEQVRTAINANASTVRRLNELENAFTGLKKDLEHTRIERAEKEIKEAEARLKIAIEHKDGLSTQEKIEVKKAMDERMDARDQERARARRTWWHERVVPNVVAALIISVVAPVGLGTFIAVLVFILRALGVEIQLP